MLKKTSMVFLMLVVLVVSVYPAQGDQIDYSGSYTQNFNAPTSADAVIQVVSAFYDTEAKMPIMKDDGFGGSYEIGNLTAGDLVMMRLNYHDDPNINRVAEAGFNSAAAKEDWWMQYNATLTFVGWPAVEDASPMPFFKPFVAVMDSAQWTTLEAAWTGVPGITATYNSTYFKLQGTNTTNGYGVSNVEATWDTTTGVLAEYKVDSLDSGLTYQLHLKFQFWQDVSEWGLAWGIGHDTMGWRWNTISYNGTDHFILDENNYNEVYQGEMLIIEAKTLSNFDGQPHINGTMATPHWRDDMSTINVDQIKKPGDGPVLFSPVIPIGNAEFVANITAMLEPYGSVYHLGNSFNYTVDMPSINHYEESEWDLSTGLLKRFIYQGNGPNGLDISIDLQLIYHFAPSGDPNFGVDHLDQRYVLNNIVNDTQNVLHLGDNGMPFDLIKGDILNVNQYSQIDQYGKEQLYLSLKTSSGDQLQTDYKFPYFGLETYDGPPFMIFTIPTSLVGTSSADWFAQIAGIWTALGYTVNNAADYLEVTATFGGLSATVRWDKADGVMSHYLVDGTDPDSGNHVTWEMTRGTSPTQDSLTGMGWGVGINTELNYDLTVTSGSLPFEDDNLGETSLAVGTYNASMTITALSDIPNNPPMVNATILIPSESITDSNAVFAMRNPGFEFVSFPGEDNIGGPPMLYLVIPIGPTSIFALFETMFTEAGYTVVNGADTFSVTATKFGQTATAVWAKDTGILQSYSFSGSFDGGATTIAFSITLATQNVNTNTNTNTGNNDNGGGDLLSGLPFDGTSVMVALPLVAFAAIVLRRRKY